MKFVLLASSVLFASTVQAKTYNWEITKVIDGDTVEVSQKFFPEELGNIHIRVAGIDTPEKKPRAKCEEEHQLAMKASAYTKSELLHKVVLVDNVKQDKYGGRIVADIHLSYGLFADRLIELGLARKYDGRTKKSWCAK